MNINKNIVGLLFALCFSIASPISAHAKHFLQVINKLEFSRFASSLPKHLMNRDIIKSETNWQNTSNASTDKDEMGLILFNYLDYSFVLSETSNQKQEARYFTQGSYTNLKLTPSSFTFNRGSDIFHGEVIAKINWDNTNKEDWLVFFSLTNPYSDLVGRYFYLVITNPNIKELPLKQEIIASQNNLINKFSIYIDEMPEYKMLELIEENRKRDEAAQKQAEKDEQKNLNIKTEEPVQTVIELDRGQYSVLESPNSLPVEEKKSFWQRSTQNTDSVTSTETKLSN